MILDPGISNIQPKGDYPPYDDGFALGKVRRLLCGEWQWGVFGWTKKNEK